MKVDQPLRGVITPQVLADLRERNEQRRVAAIQRLGNRWLLAQRVTRRIA